MGGYDCQGIAVDAMTCYGTFDGVILTTPEWVNMIITLARTELTAFEWVNSTTTVWINMIFPEWVIIVQEWLVVTQSKVHKCLVPSEWDKLWLGDRGTSDDLSNYMSCTTKYSYVLHDYHISS